MRSNVDSWATILLSSSLWLRTYPHPKFFGVLAVTAVVVWGFVQFLQVSLCSYTLIRMTRRAESCITHLSSTVPAVSGAVLALCALSRAPRGTLTWPIHPDDPGFLCSIPLHAPHQFSPSAGWLAGVRENSKPEQLQAAFSDHFQFRLCQSIFTPTRPAMHVNGVRGGEARGEQGRGQCCFVFHHASSLLYTWTEVPAV